MIRILLPHRHESLPAVRILIEPFLGEAAVLDLRQHLSHLLANVVVDHPRPGDVVPVLRGVGDRVAHEAETAAVHQVDDQLHLVEHLEVGDLGLIAGLDEGFEPGLDQRADPAAEHGLLAEEIGLGLFLERGLHDSRSAGAERARVGQGTAPRVAGRVLVDRDQSRDAHPLHVGAADEVPRTLGSDHRDVDVLVGLDLRKVDREAVREHQHRARLKVLLDRLAKQLRLARIGGQHHDDGGLGHRLGDRDRAEPVLLDALDRLAARIQPDANVLPAVAQVEGVGAALAAVADDRHRLVEPGRAVDLVVDLHAVLLITTGPDRTTSTTPCLNSSSTKSPTSFLSPANSTVVPPGPDSRTLAPRLTRPATWGSENSATTSSRVWCSCSVRSSISTTSTRRSSCLRTWSASAWPWSTCRVIRNRPGSLLGPTVMPRT